MVVPKCVKYTDARSGFRCSQLILYSFSLFVPPQAQTAQGEKTFEFDPYLLATVSPLAVCFTYEKNPLENYPHIDVSDCFNEKQMCISKDRVHTLQKLVFPG